MKKITIATIVISCLGFACVEGEPKWTEEETKDHQAEQEAKEHYDSLKFCYESCQPCYREAEPSYFIFAEYNHNCPECFNWCWDFCTPGRRALPDEECREPSLYEDKHPYDNCNDGYMSIECVDGTPTYMCVDEEPEDQWYPPSCRE